MTDYPTISIPWGAVTKASRKRQRAQELDPGGFHLVGMLVSSGQYDRAIEEVRKHLELHPKDGWAYIDGGGLINLYHLAGRHREEVEALQQAWTFFGFEEHWKRSWKGLRGLWLRGSTPVLG